MTYVMSDLHGCLGLWDKALEKIGLSANDTLYVLGDVLDKGDRPIGLLKKIMGAGNIRMINGNHESDFLANCPIAFKKNRTLREIAVYDQYIKNGGKSTILEFAEENKDTRKSIVNYLRHNNYYAEVSCNNQKFVFAHGGISGFSPRKKLSEYSREQLTLHRYKNNERFFNDKILICGHTPNISSDFKTPADVFVSRDGLFYNIDCGCAFPEYGGRLAVLRLDDFHIEYIT